MVFSDGQKFEVLEIKKNSYFTFFIVAKDASGRTGLLRLPRSDGVFGVPTHFIQSTISGAALLEFFGVSHAKIFRSFGGEYAFVDYIKDATPFSDAFLNLEPSEIDIRVEAFKNFWIKNSAFSSFGDFNLGQIVYSPGRKEWFLLDWTSRHILNTHGKQKSIALLSAIAAIKHSKRPYSPDKIDTLPEATRVKIINALSSVEYSFNKKELEILESLSNALHENEKNIPNVLKSLDAWPKTLSPQSFCEVFGG